MTREQRLGYERRILAAEVETVRLARKAKRFVELIERNTKELDAALCVANQALDRRGHDRLVVEPWMPALLSLLDDLAQVLPDECDNQKVVEYWPEDPTQWGDDVAYAMRECYEANRPLRWWETRNPPGTWGCIADNLMLGLFNIATSAIKARRAAATEIDAVHEHAVPKGDAHAQSD